MNKEISIIIPAYNAKKWLLELFNSIEKSEYKNFEVILVNNGSSDGPYEYIKILFPNIDIKIINIIKNRGFTGGCNYGSKFAIGKYLFFSQL